MDTWILWIPPLPRFGDFGPGTEARHDEDLGDLGVPGPPGMRHHHPHEVLGGRELVPSKRCNVPSGAQREEIRSA